MKEFVVISGKGGTGKTSLTAALSYVAGTEVVVADCDVDAADMHLLLRPEILTRELFLSGYKAVIDKQKCSNCNKCRSVCRYDGVNIIDGIYTVDNLECEGCAYCYHICDSQAITMQEQVVGECYISKICSNTFMSHAKLFIGADNSGKLVAKVKNEAKKTAEENEVEYILVDGSPGIGCPVISSLSGADLAVIVTEPTLSGFSDMKRICELTKKFMIPMGCIINKADINLKVKDKIIGYLKEHKIYLIDCFDYDNDFNKAISLGKNLVEYNPDKWKGKITAIWTYLSGTIHC